MSPAEIRAQARRMIDFVDQRLHAGTLSPEEHTISVGEISRWAFQAIARAKTNNEDVS